MWVFEAPPVFEQGVCGANKLCAGVITRALQYCRPVGRLADGHLQHIVSLAGPQISSVLPKIASKNVAMSGLMCGLQAWDNSRNVDVDFGTFALLIL